MNTMPWKKKKEKRKTNMQNGKKENISKINKPCCLSPVRWLRGHGPPSLHEMKKSANKESGPESNPVRWIDHKKAISLSPLIFYFILSFYFSLPFLIDSLCCWILVLSHDHSPDCSQASHFSNPQNHSFS